MNGLKLHRREVHDDVHVCYTVGWVGIKILVYKFLPGSKVRVTLRQYLVVVSEESDVDAEVKSAVAAACNRLRPSSTDAISRDSSRQRSCKRNYF